ncbi:hypothetical protein LC724_11565 [Blautia sp. RD014234]|nr:hypothetical protein [Blautia parvula]
MSVGIGKYGTKKDGGIYMCVLLDMYDQKPVACSYGVYYGPQLVQKALEIYFSFWSRKDSEGVKGIPFSTAAVILYSETGLTAAYWAVSRSGRP